MGWRQRSPWISSAPSTPTSLFPPTSFLFLHISFTFRAHLSRRFLLPLPLRRVYTFAIQSHKIMSSVKPPQSIPQPTLARNSTLHAIRNRSNAQSIPVPPSLLDKPYLQAMTLPPTSSPYRNSPSSSSQADPSRSTTSTGYGHIGGKEDTWLRDTIPAAYDTGDTSNMNLHPSQSAHHSTRSRAHTTSTSRHYQSTGLHQPPPARKISDSYNIYPSSRHHSSAVPSPSVSGHQNPSQR